jgi:hypothetical protein
MGLFGKLFGTPPDHTEEKKEKEVVKTPEFDSTQYGKKLGVSVGVLVAAAIAALKAAGVEEVTEPAVLVGALGLAAAGLLGTSFVMATDIAARAFLSGEGSAQKAADSDEDSAPKEVIAAPPGTQVWLDGETEPHPLLAMSGDGEKVSSYLVATGSTVERKAGDKSVKAIDGSAKWHDAADIRAIRPAAWP